MEGQPEDKGLFFPLSIPRIEASFFSNISDHSKEAIALKVIAPYTGHSIPFDVLERIVAETMDFNIPLVAVEKDIYSLELFHGPTLAFKDVGARFMSRCLSYFLKDQQKKTTVLVATSGDTGSAVANGFYDVDGIDVVILFPSGKVSSIQELQLTTPGKNIRAIEINGDFDDCQRMVKNAFADVDIKNKLSLTSANSINIARWLPQQFYYFLAYQQWNEKNNLPVISVPSGNFGNLCAGLLAYSSGLPVAHFIAACNANDTIPEFLRTGNMQSKPTVPTISNAMDVSIPSNFIRILEIFGDDIPALKKILSATSVSDQQTKDTVRSTAKNSNYITDPHGAVGLFSLQQYLLQHPGAKGFFLETAHPVKFYDVIEPILNTKLEIPVSVKGLMQLPAHKSRMDADDDELKEFLLRM
jgi:threonine synthase